LISSNHIFYQTMSMLPFATKTDMFEAIKKADAKVADVESFLATLLAENDAGGARAQLKALWIGHVRALFEEDEDAQAGSLGSGAREVVGGGIRARAVTPPDSPHDDA
jgi:hypothetical protein